MFRLELAGDLGLREWVDSALYPVSNADLFAGNHPAPGVAPAKTPPSAVAAPKPPNIGQASEKAVHGLTHDAIQKLFEEITAATNAAKDDSSQIGKSAAAAEASAEQIRAALRSMKKTRAIYASVATAEIIGKIAKYVTDLQMLYRYAQVDITNITAAQSDVGDRLPEIMENYQSFAKAYQNEKYDDKGVQQSPENYQTDHDVVLLNKPFLDTDLGNVKRAADNLQELQTLAAQISVRPDPPEDSLLHSIQFIVAYGANVSPSWSLIAFKGPALSGTLAAAQGIRTHILNIAIGPRGAPDATSEQARLINNQTILLSHE